MTVVRGASARAPGKRHAGPLEPATGTVHEPAAPAPSASARSHPRTTMPSIRSHAAWILVALAPGARGQGLTVDAPVENPITAEKAILGKILFWEEQLSHDNTTACGTCHIPSAGGGDPRIGAGTRHPGRDRLFDTVDDVFGSPGVVRADAADRFEPDALFEFDVQVTPRNTPSATRSFTQKTESGSWPRISSVDP